LSALLSSTRFDTSTLALTRTTPLHTSALQIDSPLGLLLYGEVGRGKSMLLDLLYTSLPSRKKRRWHFNTFMLDLYRRIELSRLERVGWSLPDARPRSLFGRSHHQQTISDHEHVMLTLARDTICDSPILFLDEFQMPDRTASKLVGSFFTSFFHLGGVLVASSNRMPEELSKAAGIEFGGLQRSRDGGGGGGGGGIWGLGWGLGRESEGERSAKTDFGLFLEVLRARCEVWEMEGERDWRREGDDELVSVDADEDDAGGGLFGENPATTVVDGDGGSLTTPAGASSTLAVTGDAALSADSPPHYHVAIPSTPSSSFETDLRTLNPSDEWTPMTLTIYARHLTLPSTYNGILKSTFSALCTTYLGPADYVSLCSTFHTLILTDVPVLTLSQKNEARRFITLLDALYEARCRLLIEAAAPPDKLFFPETRGARRGAGTVEAEQSDSMTSEAFSEIYQDSTAPFRPNVSVYTEGNIRVSEPEPEPTPKPSFTASLHNPSRRSVLADEDADFGPTYGNGRGSGISRASSSVEEAVQRKGMGEGPDFTSTSALTGEDERFAYKRARSRLWEMCGRKWWDERVSVANVTVNDMRDEMGSWRPIGKEGRTWERFVDEAERLAWEEEAAAAAAAENTNLSSENTRAAKESDPKTDSLFRHGASPFRNSASPPPKFGWQHAWGMMRWGKMAGDWGKGIDAFTDTSSSSQDNEPKAESGKARKWKK
jgi:predicted ATPase